MRSLFSRQKQAFKCPKSYLIARFWWVQKMDRLAGGLSKKQLWCSLILFTILGTALSLYMALKGFLAFSPDSMQIDAVSAIRPADQDCNSGSYLIDFSNKNEDEQSGLSIYIDSAINLSAPVYLHPNDSSVGKKIWSSPITGEDNKSKDKK